MIEVKNLKKSYPTPGEDVEVLRGLDFSLGDGETAAIVGPSGCGKTTLLNLLGALDRPTEGSLSIGGEDLAKFSEKEASAFRNKELGFVFQQQHLLPQLTVLENVLVPRLAGGWEESESATQERAQELLNKMGLRDRLTHLPYQLSGGERLRTAVARALVNRPRLVLADEPTGSLDPKSTETIADLFLKMNREEGVTLVVVTHNEAFAQKMGRVLRLEEGRLVEVSPKP
jgi:lipoprotein-releasing system ATP-binding protein